MTAHNSTPAPFRVIAENAEVQDAPEITLNGPWTMFHLRADRGSAGWRAASRDVTRAQRSLLDVHRKAAEATGDPIMDRRLAAARGRYARAVAALPHAMPPTPSDLATCLRAVAMLAGLRDPDALTSPWLYDIDPSEGASEADKAMAAVYMAAVVLQLHHHPLTYPEKQALAAFRARRAS